ncbi:MAG TPA: hypothetical protein VGD91_18000, partial [Trebonia sp.]
MSGTEEASPMTRRARPGGGRGPVRPRGIYVALGLLTLCAVFAATAGVREALVTTTHALRQTLAAAPSPASAIAVSTSGEGVADAWSLADPEGAPGGGLTDTQVGEITSQLRAGYDGSGQGLVRLTPASSDWASLTSGLTPVSSALPAVAPVAVQLEVTYRQPLEQHLRLVAGHLPGSPPPAVPVPGDAQPGRYYTPLLPVVVTRQTAAAFGLRVGSRVRVAGAGSVSAAAVITFQVSGIVTQTDPDSAFWQSDVTAVAPFLQDRGLQPPLWIGGVIAGPGEAAAVQQDFGPGGITMQWEFPLALGSVTGQQAQPLSDALTALQAQTPQLRGDVGPAGPALTATSLLSQVLGAYLVTAQSVSALLWLLYVSLTVTGLVVLLLTARMVAVRRSAELTLVRARGASLGQVGRSAAGAAAAVCVPAAVIAVALAILAVPGTGAAAGGSAGGWWPQAAILLVAIGGPACIAAWQQRLPRQRAVRQRQPARRRGRLVAEAALVAAAAGGIVIFRHQGTDAGSGVNFYTSAAPVLVALPAVIVVLRIYPVALRLALRAAARSAAAPAFLGLARAARS